MATRKIIDIEHKGERVWPKGHAKATFLSDGRDVDTAIKVLENSIPDVSEYVTLSELDTKQNIIPDLENIRQGAEKGATALQSYTEQYKGTITGVSANGTSVATSGVANIPAASTSAYGVTKLSSATNSTSTTLAATASAVKAAYDLANGKQDKLVSGTNIKTINGASILGSGNITIEGGGNSGANVQAVDTGDIVDDVNVSYATIAYVDGLIGDINSVLESIIGGGPSINLISITVDDTINGTSYVCQAEEGMTWVDWINSKYNTYGWYIDTSFGYIFLSDGRYALAYMGSPFSEYDFTGYVMEDGAIGFHTYEFEGPGGH